MVRGREVDDMITLKEAAAIMGVSEDTVWRRCKEGHISYIKHPSPGCKGRIRVKRTDVYSYLEKCYVHKRVS